MKIVYQGIEQEFSELRKTFEWGTFGKSGDEPLRHIKLYKITDEHLNNILKHLEERSSTKGEVYRVIQTEMEYRIKELFKPIKKNGKSNL